MNGFIVMLHKRADSCCCFVTNSQEKAVEEAKRIHEWEGQLVSVYGFENGIPNTLVTQMGERR